MVSAVILSDYFVIVNYGCIVIVIACILIVIAIHYRCIVIFIVNNYNLVCKKFMHTYTHTNIYIYMYIDALSLYACMHIHTYFAYVVMFMKPVCTFIVTA